MSRIGTYGIPGTGAAQFSVGRNIFWGGDDSRIKALRTDAIVRSSVTDAGSIPITHLRPGLLLALHATENRLVAWTPSANDRSSDLFGVLEKELVMLDSFGTAVDRHCGVVVQAPLEAASLLINGANLVGSADEYLARRQLGMLGCILDDDPQLWLAGLTPRSSNRSANYTIVAADNGTRFTSFTAATTYTLPAIQAGLQFEFLRSDAFNLVIASAEGDNIIVGNDPAADSVTWSTAGNLTGASMAIEARYVNGVLRWVPRVLAVPFSTGAFLTQTLAT